MDGKLWLMGGEVPSEDEDDDEEDEYAVNTDTVVVYDPANDSWEAGPALRTYATVRATVHDGEVFLLSEEGAVFVYRSGAWEEGTAGDRGYAGAACGSILLG